MPNFQPDLFTSQEGEFLSNTYKGQRVEFLGYSSQEEIDGRNVTVAQIIIFTPQKRKLRVYFTYKNDKVEIHGFSFGTTTHRPQKEKKYTIDEIQMSQVLLEIQSKHITFKKTLGEDINSEILSIFGYIPLIKRFSNLESIDFCGCKLLVKKSGIIPDKDMMVLYFDGIEFLDSSYRRVKVVKQGRFIDYSTEGGKNIVPNNIPKRLLKAVYNLMNSGTMDN